MKRVILDHHLDEEQGVYRVLIGLVTEEDMGVMDEHGEPVLLPSEPVMRPVFVEVHHDPADEPEGSLVKLPYTTFEPQLDGNGDPVMEPMIGEDGEPVTFQRPMMERGVVIHDANEVLFSADDPQWEGLKEETIAERQVDVVRDALAEVDKANDTKLRSLAARKAMPGIGQEL